METYSCNIAGMGVANSYEYKRNFSIGIDPEDIALFNALYRTSLKGRKDVAKLMFTDEDDDEQLVGVIDKSYTSRVAEIFNVYLKCMGIEMDFVDENDYLRVFGDNTVSHHVIDGKHYMCTDYQAYLLDRINDIANEILDENPVILNKELIKEVKARLKKYDYVNGSDKDGEDTLKMAKKLLMSKAAIKRLDSIQSDEPEEIDPEITVEQEEYDDGDEGNEDYL